MNDGTTRWWVLAAWGLAVGCGAPSGGEAGAVTADGAPAPEALAATVQGGAPEVAPAAFGEPLAGITADERTRFDAGRAEFLADETPEEGLGPVFNDTSCAQCHSVPAVGGGSPRLETRFGARAGGRFDPLAGLGGSLRQERAIDGTWPAADPTQPACTYAGEVVPAAATVVSLRRTTPLFGLGLVDAVPEAAFLALARDQARRFPGEAGRLAVVREVPSGRPAVGRFGWKNQVPSLRQFAGDAYLNEMGITSPDFPDESCPQGDCALLRCNPLPGINDAGDGVVAFTDFMVLLGPPPRGAVTAAVQRGERVFEQVGCARCHQPTLVTGPSAVAALRRVAFHPYSDFLLHDMGSLGDGIALGAARGSEFRTAPLWGLRSITTFLHDGRAGTVDEAIRAHDGQARRARGAYLRLGGRDRADLLAFLDSL